MLINVIMDALVAKQRKSQEKNKNLKTSSSNDKEGSLCSVSVSSKSSPKIQLDSPIHD
jgi:nitrous oxide reductase accessory protein NosL